MTQPENLVKTSKSTAAEQHLSHVGRAVGQQTGISSYTGKLSWAAATRSIRECKMRIERIGGLRLDTDPEVWFRSNNMGADVGGRSSHAKEHSRFKASWIREYFRLA